ncbi:hypothetical protein [Nocardia sp. NPDC057353]|uniref:hypothetical protein n=1 Tax=Nocardia sp. NPDC057353 TaxID=3346104 RepID=UPI00363C59CB
MAALGSCDRPFFGRATKMTVEPLNVADVQAMTGLDAATAIDAASITGGFSEIVRSWQPERSRLDFLRDVVTDPWLRCWSSVSSRCSAEFPEGQRARTVLEAIGSGERTFSAIAARAGGAGALPASTLHFAGSIKWLEDRPFDRHDYDALTRSLPGIDRDTARVAVSRAGTADRLPIDEHWGPEELVAAWR